MNFDSIFAKDENGNVYKGYAVKKHDRIQLVIPKEAIPAKGINKLYAFFGVFAQKEGNDGYYIIGGSKGRFSGYLTYFKKRADFTDMVGFQLLSMFGVKNAEDTYLCVPTGMRYDFRTYVEKKDGAYSIGLYYDLSMCDVYEDIVLDVFSLGREADWKTVAKRYREYKLCEDGCKLLRDRIKDNPALEYCANAPEIRIRMGWKPVPPTVFEQTDENEPEMYVSCSFERVKDIIDELKKRGVRGAELCLVGWNKSGHDGRWPTVFPVEPALGGEQKLRELINYARLNGYKIVCHTNSTDCYSISDKWDGGSIAMKKKNGEIAANACWSAGRMYNLCPEKALEYARELMPELKKLGFNGIHYIDVISIVAPRNCFDKNHPVTSRRCAEINKEIARLAKEYIGGFSSEGAGDVYADVLDSALYMRFNYKMSVGTDKGIPLWEFIFHGIVMASPSINSVNYTIKGSEERLEIYECASRPSFYINSKFVEGDNSNWMGNIDLVVNTREQLEYCADKIAEGCAEYEKVSRLQTQTIEDYTELCDGVFVTTFSDGTRIISNRSTAPIACFNTEIPSFGYAVIQP